MYLPLARKGRMQSAWHHREDQEQRCHHHPPRLLGEVPHRPVSAFGRGQCGRETGHERRTHYVRRVCVCVRVCVSVCACVGQTAVGLFFFVGVVVVVVVASQVDRLIGARVPCSPASPIANRRQMRRKDFVLSLPSPPKNSRKAKEICGCGRGRPRSEAPRAPEPQSPRRAPLVPEELRPGPGCVRVGARRC